MTSAPVPIRVRGPKGISTISVDLESTIEELQQLIFSVTEIPPSVQDIKTGYPPKPVTLVPSLPISSLSLSRGDQLIVNTASGNLSPSSSGLVHEHKHQSPVSSASTTKRDNYSPLVPPSEEKLSTSRPAEMDKGDHVNVDGSVLVLRVVPDDNSCLFSSVAVVFEQDISAAPKLRQVIANAIRADPITYDEAFLGQPPEQYINTILKPSSWGGAIELSIFATHYKTEISSFDVETGRCDRFGEGQHDSRCILMYSGIHYDAVSLGPTLSAPLDFHQTVFPVSSTSIFDAAKTLTAKRREKRAYTNTTTFDLRCLICSKGLKGEKEAREHAKETSHAEFGEY